MIEFVSVTGAIGSGKSSFLKRLSERYQSSAKPGYRLVFAQEHVDSWVSQGWLQDFYKQPEKLSFAFQMRVLADQVQLLENVLKEPESTVPTFVLTERSPLDGILVFGELLRKDGLMLEREYELYTWFAQRQARLPNHVVWIDVDAEVCLERIHKRSRAAESPTDDAYFARVAQQYQHAMPLRNEQVLRIDNNAQNPSAIDEHCQRIEEWLASKCQ